MSMKESEELVATAQQEWGSTGIDRIITMGKKVEEGRVEILQQPEEIVWFVDEISTQLPVRNVVLEIGLFRGGTHLIWRKLFKHAVSVERSYREIVNFSAGLVNEPEKSSFIWAESYSLRVPLEIKKRWGQVDMLFIDGDHSYSGVEGDYLNYEPCVRSGGIVSFHDTFGTPDVHRFVSDLKEGQHIVSERVKGVQFHDSPCQRFGITYYIKS